MIHVITEHVIMIQFNINQWISLVVAYQVVAKLGCQNIKINQSKIFPITLLKANTLTVSQLQRTCLFTLGIGTIVPINTVIRYMFIRTIAPHEIWCPYRIKAFILQLVCYMFTTMCPGNRTNVHCCQCFSFMIILSWLYILNFVV